MNETNELNPKQKKAVMLICLCLIPVVVLTIYDVNEKYQQSDSYGAEYILEGWIEENTSCNSITMHITLKTDNTFAPSDHIPALEKWYDHLDCSNPDSKYWRDADYDYDTSFGTNLYGEQIQFLEFDEWRESQK